MGFNTPILILNDGFDQIQKNPEEFVEGIARALNDGDYVRVGSHANCVQVLPTQHADVTRLIVSEGNWMCELSPWSKETMRLYSRDDWGRKIVRSRLAEAKEMLADFERKLNELDRRDGRVLNWRKRLV